MHRCSFIKRALKNINWTNWMIYPSRYNHFEWSALHSKEGTTTYSWHLPHIHYILFDYWSRVNQKTLNGIFNIPIWINLNCMRRTTFYFATRGSFFWWINPKGDEDEKLISVQKIWLFRKNSTTWYGYEWSRNVKGDFFNYERDILDNDFLKFFFWESN